MKLNKIIILTLIMAIIISVPKAVKADEKYINNNGIEMTKEEQINLTNLGFSKYEIENMTKEEFIINHNLIGVVVSKQVDYYKTTTTYDDNFNKISQLDSKVDLSEYDMGIGNEISMLSDGYIETEYKKMTTQIISLQGKYRYKISLDWKTVPKVRSYDIIGIGIDTSVYIYSDIVFQQNYCYSNGSCSSSNLSLLKQSSTGGAALFSLPSSTSVKTLSSYLYFTVDKSSTGTLNNLYAYGDYSHATENTNTSYINNFTINKAGINLNSASVSKYDAIPVSKASWSGAW